MLTVKRYCAAVSVAGGVALVALLDTGSFDYIVGHPVIFGFLSAGVVIGELLPVKIPRRGNDEEIALSTCFSLALLLAGGLGPALIVQGAASILQDLLARKPWWRVCFNLGQYTLSMVAALLVVRLLSHGLHLGTMHPFTADELPAVLVSAAVFFLVNASVVGVAVALYQDAPVLPYFRRNALFVLTTGCVMLFLAPIIVAAAAYSVFLLPLFAAPMLAIYYAGRESSRSEYAARHDALTDLPNRSAFHATVRDAIERDGAHGSVLLMDLDRFKEVNDTLGHRFGDLLLQQVAGRVAGHLGSSARIARLGGDEFAVLLEGADSESTLELARGVVECLRQPFDLDDFVVDAQASVGVALYPDDGLTVEALLQRADVAMYRAKETHAGAALYDERHDHHSPAKLALTADLRTGVETGQFVVWYQPQLDIATDQVTTVEALVRWEHPDLGLLPPDIFLGIAERTNVITLLTQRVLEDALRQVADWRGAGLDVTVAVNISARVLGDRGLTRRVAAALGAAGVPASRLKLEVTESTLMADPELARAVLRDLSGLGVAIAVDDYGTGYSSLAYLTDLPVSEVKIDRAFVSRLASGSREGVIVASTVELAHQLGLRAVAEGVEDRALLARLNAIGCDVAQGFGISRPMDAMDATRWLLRAQAGDSAPLAAGELV